MLILIETTHIAKRGKRLLSLLFFILLPFVATAQSFDLQVTVNHETCNGNGMLTFSVNGASQTPPVNYKVYLLPNTTIPIANSTATTLQGQQAGKYIIEATQTVNGTKYTDQQTVEILYKVAPITYAVSGTTVVCGNDGTITVTTLSGTAAAFEIISGPVSRPLQPDNTFTELPAGFYKIRVYDGCGAGQVVEYNLLSNESVLDISNTVLPDTELPGCELITIKHTITHTSWAGIVFPLTAEITVYPPDGSPPLNYTVNIPTGNPDSHPIEQVIPFYYNTPYYYDFVLTDGCGNKYTKPQNLVNAALSATLDFRAEKCSKILVVSLAKFVAPYTITFVNPPAGFEPEKLNANYPSGFTDPEVEFGDENNGIPLGEYSIIITDACGRTATAQAELEPDPEPEATYISSNNDCLNNLGMAEVAIMPKIIGSIFITAAPPEYALPENLPQDVTQYVSGTRGLIMYGLPPGTYVFKIVDICGIEYPLLTVVVPNYTSSNASVISRPDCTAGMASAMLGSGLNSAIITEAPGDFPHPVPYDITTQLDSSGNAYLDGLPPGKYTFTLNSVCFTTPVTKTVQLTGNFTSQNDFSYTPYCGSFDLEMHHTATPTAAVMFWLQREYGNGTGVWGHPDGSEAAETPIPAPQNAVMMQNNFLALNLQYPTGHYRVVKTFKAFSPNGENGQKDCYEIIYDFNYQTGLQITGARNLACHGPADVEISASGLQPFTYTITEKNGSPVNISNGNSNIFSSLEPATYTITVADQCGNKEPIIFNVANLPSLVSAGTAPAIILCDENADGNEMFDLSQQTAHILNGQDNTQVNISYHISLDDATNRLNPLPLNYNTTTGTIIYARAEHLSNINLCYDISNFSLIVNQKPFVDNTTTVYGCEGIQNTLSAPSGYASYLWSTGETTQTIYPEHAGTYSLTIEDSNGCKTVANITLTTSSPPEVVAIDTSDWTDTNNTITVILAPPAGSQSNPEFSIDGFKWQTSNIFTGLKPGRYNVYIRDRNGCGYFSSDAIFLLMYPKFFTPNGDNVNEYWRIRFAANAEPNLMVQIYDRYGKLITGFDTRSPGWDGTLNGAPLPSTDYWFVVKRQDGKEYRGHFAMIR